jgi:cob(I)alamin adenosyltransferase
VAAGSETIARLYTRTGDRGDTGLVGGARAPKDGARVQAYGSLDEFAALLGVVRAELPRGTDPISRTLRTLQHETFLVMSELATPSSATPLAHRIEPRHVKRAEDSIDSFSDEAGPLQTFILPGGTRIAALLHLARTVVRRAEREIVALHRTEAVRPEVLEWVNRVSDLLFAAARVANRRAGSAEEPPDYTV